MVISALRNLTKTTIKGGEIISRMLAAEGVDTVFGIIDGTYFGLISTLDDHGLRLVTPRHETSAAHMAGAYARLTGTLGVCIASNGPGVANILPGVAVESAEGNRVLLITSSRRVGIAYPDRGGTFQYFPQVEVTRPMTKWSGVVPSVERLPGIMRKALRLSFTGRPGVVHVDVPESIMNSAVEVDAAWFRDPAQYRPTTPLQAPDAQVRQAAAMLLAAERPLIHAGSGVVHAGAEAELARVAALLSAPITTSWGARCAVDERTREAVPMVFIDAVNKARNDADLVLVLGSRLGETDWWGKAPYWATPDAQAVIQVDIDSEHLGVNRPTELALQADAKAFLAQLLTILEATPRAVEPARRRQLDTLNAMCQKRRKALDKKHLGDTSVPMAPAHVPSVCQQVFDEDAVCVIDGGNTSVWTNFFSQVKRPHTVLGTPKMGMLGAGVGQALGAKAAFPDRQVYCVIGDGAMGMHQQEIETAVRNGLQVIWLVLCDKQWGMVKMNQQFMLKPLKTLALKSLRPDELINTELSETEFDQLARAMGAHGERVADPAELRGAIERSLASGKPAVIHVDVDPVKHMWAPHLKTFKDMHGEPSGKK